MDEGDVEDVGMVSGAEDVPAQVKERAVLRQSEGVVFRERDLPRSSVQQFVDLLDGNDRSTTVNVVDVSQGPCTSYGESGEGRVQELTLEHLISGLGGNEGEMMDEMLNDWQHGHQLGGGFGAGMSDERPNLKGKWSTTSSSSENLRRADALTGQPTGDNANVNPGHPTHNRSDIILRDALYSGEMSMKIISRSSEYPEYFVKNTLKDKGVLCRRPISTGAEGRGYSIEEPAAPLITSNPQNMRETSCAPPSHGITSFELGAGLDSVDAGVTLREWITSGQQKSRKVDNLYIFKEILDLVYAFHSAGKVLGDLRPSCFRLLPSRKIEYCGRVTLHKEMTGTGSIVHKDVSNMRALKRPLEQGDTITRGNSSWRYLPPPDQQHGVSVVDQLEDMWYRSPEELLGRNLTSSSNIYCLGVFLFELLSSFNSGKVHAAAMSDLRHRILPPNFLSENPKEAGFCLWLLHPQPSLRPTASDVLQSEVVGGFQALCRDVNSSSIEQEEEDSELLLHFLSSMKEQKQNNVSKLVHDLGCIEADIKELENRHLAEKPTSPICTQGNLLREGRSLSSEVTKDSRFLKNVAQLQSAYFSARSRIHESVNNNVVREDREILINREKLFADRTGEEESAPLGDQGAFFDGLCKYARYSKLEVCGTLRNREITNSMNVICSLSFDRDGDYFAAAGVSKKIKIFEFQALCDNSVDIHYPASEMTNKSKLSCVCWNNYIRNYLASTDHYGIVKLWDASTGQGFSQHVEHEKRAWSIDFSMLDPTKFASGSDDCSVKLWNINERNSVHTIQNIANVCCVQFSPYSSHLLAFGSADYKIYCYDLRNANVPWCILGGHEKAVSYVKFVDSATLVSASTDNTLKLWDLNRSSPGVVSNNACSSTLRGHTNKKNFVGLSVADGYISCGSETNEVYTYYKSLPMPITSHQFGSIDPTSGKETDIDNGQFVSSVCWKGKSNMVVAANSSGCIKVLQMV